MKYFIYFISMILFSSIGSGVYAEDPEKQILCIVAADKDGVQISGIRFNVFINGNVLSQPTTDLGIVKVSLPGLPGKIEPGTLIELKIDTSYEISKLWKFRHHSNGIIKFTKSEDCHHVILEKREGDTGSLGPLKSLKGRVIDDETKSPIVGATVIIWLRDDSEAKKITDEDGIFETPVNGSIGDFVSLRVVKEGYKNKVLPFYMNKSSLEKTIKLERPNWFSRHKYMIVGSIVGCALAAKPIYESLFPPSGDDPGTYRIEW